MTKLDKSFLHDSQVPGILNYFWLLARNPGNINFRYLSN